MDKFYDGFELYREDKIIYARFLRPHQVISTCRAAGGLRTGLQYLYNHQGCEPAGHMHSGSHSKAAREPEGYRQDVCDKYGLPAEACATLGTAANMHLAQIEQLSFRDLTVVAVVTGGVEGNAGRAGDPAFGWEGPDGYESLKPAEAESGEPKPGTINTMIFINLPLTPGALTRTIMTATEAKSAALQELAVNSRYSDGLATGTGTDQIAVAAMEIDGRRPLTGAGKHSKLGELIGRTVKAAVKGTLLRQNGMTTDRQCSVKIHLERFGLNTESLISTISEHLSENEAALLRNNFRGIFHDPPTVAAVAALAHLKDKFAWGILPPLVWGEVMGSFAAQVSAAVSGRYEKIAEYRQTLAPKVSENTNRHFVILAARALALGFKDKWSWF
jgi:adenosylcobinamide amidohydrolase